MVMGYEGNDVCLFESDAWTVDQAHPPCFAAISPSTPGPTLLALIHCGGQHSSRVMLRLGEKVHKISH